MQVTITDLSFNDTEKIEQVAQLLVEAFAENWPEAWPDMGEALDTVRESFGEERISRVAVTESGEAVGWIGGISDYDGNVWELHPLVVKPNLQHRGIGRLLVDDLEARVRERGGLTITLGTDDVSNQTTVSGVDLYPDVYRHIQNIRNLRGHPYEFYQKLGYSIIGLLPDANGPGKPDILMAKRVSV